MAQLCLLMVLMVFSMLCVFEAQSRSKTGATNFVRHVTCHREHCRMMMMMRMIMLLLLLLIDGLMTVRTKAGLSSEKKEAPNQGPQYGADTTTKMNVGYWMLGVGHFGALSGGVNKWVSVHRQR